MFLLCGCGKPELKKESITIEVGNELELNAGDFFETSEKKLEKISFDTSKIDTEQPGDYIAEAKYEKEKYVIKVKVEDTIAPVVKMRRDYIFTNDYKTFDYASIIESIDDATKCTVILDGICKKITNFSTIDEEVIQELTGKLSEASGTGTKEKIEITEDGIYNGVLKISDTSGNSTYKKIIIFYDTTAPSVKNFSNFTVEQEDVTSKPEVDFTRYTIIDNFDGEITTENIHTLVNLIDKEKHQYKVSIMSKDRAGNTLEASCILTVRKKENNDSKEKGETIVSNETSEETVDIADNSEYDGEGNWHHKDHGFSYSNELVGRYCVYLDGVHHEVTKEVYEAAGNAYFIASSEDQAGAYVIDNGDGTFTIHSLGQSLPRDISAEEYSNIKNEEFLSIAKYYNSYEEFKNACEVHIHDAVAAVIY